MWLVRHCSEGLATELFRILLQYSPYTVSQFIDEGLPQNAVVWGSQPLNSVVLVKTVPCVCKLNQINSVQPILDHLEWTAFASPELLGGPPGMDCFCQSRVTRWTVKYR